MFKLREKFIIEATDGDNFVVYEYKNGGKVEDGTPIGYEYQDRKGMWHLKLKRGIRYSNY